QQASSCLQENGLLRLQLELHLRHHSLHSGNLRKRRLARSSANNGRSSSSVEETPRHRIVQWRDLTVMKALEAQTPQPYSLPLPKAGYAIVGLLAIFIAVITGLNWQAGLTLTLVLAYMVVISVRLEWGIYIIVAFAVLCIDGWAPNRSPEDVVFRLSIGHIYIMEFAVYGSLASYFVRRALDKRPVSDRRFFAVTPLGTPLKVFAALLPLFAIYGLALGNATKEALGYEEWRSLFMAIVLYFLLTTIIRTREESLKLFWWFLGLNTILGLFSLALYFLGSQGPLPLIFG